jgi:predicted Zn-dependent protease with MMP-like domain
MHMSDRDFRRLVEEALGLLPAEFRPYLQVVAVVIVDWPPDALLDELDVPEDETLVRPLHGKGPHGGERRVRRAAAQYHHLPRAAAGGLPG